MQHLAIIPDGNRRWASTHKLEALQGHTKGKDVLRIAARVCLQNNIPYLSVYIFSRENFRRSEAEKNSLFKLISFNLSQNLGLFQEHGIRLRFLGDPGLIPHDFALTLQHLEHETRLNDRLQVNLLLGYGAQHEIVSAIKTIAQQVKDGEVTIDQIDEVLVSKTLFTSGIPDPDLIIRTGGAVRLSNFLLYQSAYSEFKFLDCFWPEVTDAILQQCIDDFKVVKRNFGS